MTTGRSGWLVASLFNTASPSRSGMRRSTIAMSNGSVSARGRHSSPFAATTTAWGRVDRVGQEIQDHLLELVVLSLDHRLARPGPDLDDEAGLREPGTDEIGGIAHQLLDVDRPAGAGRAPRDVEQAGDDVDDTHDLRLDDREPARDVVGHDGGRQVLAQQLQVPGDGVERRADLVRD